MPKCWQCEEEMQKSTSVEFSQKFKGEDVVFRSPGYECNCGYKTVSGNQLDEYNINKADAYRRKHGLLTSGEIKAIRRKLKMGKRKFAEFLGVSDKSVKRWEKGKVQNLANDNLIRMKAEREEIIGGDAIVA